MGSVSKQHYLPNKEDRVPKQGYHPIYKKACGNREQFDRIERLLDEITVDYIGGMPKSDIYAKLCAGGYKNGKKDGVQRHRFNDYIMAIETRLSFDRIVDKEKMKDFLYSSYLKLYKEAMANGKINESKGILDSLARLTGVISDKPQQNVQINSDKEQVTISFGFDNNKEEVN